MKRNKKIFVCILPLIAIAFLYLAAFLYDKLIVSRGVPCILNLYTGYYCPGCGNTRSVMALLRGDIIASLRYNPAIIMLALVCTIFYIELLFKTFSKPKKILPRNGWFLFAVLGSLFIFYILRNFIPEISPSF